ncbi:MAG: Zn-dependent hydrolase [Chitinophagaceae bacterium]|nr:Zn-dependent hydrolase [Chitinophagaceae bacterium]
MPLSKATLVQKRIDSLARLTDSKKNLSRQFGTPAFVEAAKKIKEFMEEAGLETMIDSAANVRGRIATEDPEAKTLVIGSHFDTIENSGKYNGVLGVLVAITAAASIKRQGHKLPFNLEIVGFSEGEGVRFHSAHLGSRALTGTFDDQLLFLEDEKGITLKEVLRELGTDYDRISKDFIPADKWLGFLDIHIEPGNQLQAKNLPVALAHSILGHKRIDIKFTGVAAHAGSLPMDERRDALGAAAKFVLKVEDYASKGRNSILATIGRLKVLNAATNMIPSQVTCSLDMRGLDEDKLNEAYEDLYSICEKICHKRGIYFEWKLLQETNPIICDEVFSQYLRQAIEIKGYKPLNIISGLATEATIISIIAPVTVMLIRDSQGLSYNPHEEVSTDDIELAVDIIEEFIKQVKL